MAEVKKVYAACCEIIGDLVEVGGIGKDHKNQQQNFAYRGIDDVYNILAALLVKRRVLIIPRVKESSCEVRQTAGNPPKALYFTKVMVEFDFVSAEDGSSFTATTAGEAMDMADKSTSKAMSMAYKYACFQVFCIPVDVPDADATTPPDTQPPQRQPQQGQRNQHGQGQRQHPQGKPPQQKPQGPVNQGEIDEMRDAASDADDVMLVSFSKRLYTWWRDKRINKQSASELAREISARRSNLVDAAIIGQFEAMVTTFESSGLLTANEASVFLQQTRSRLNLPIDGEGE